MQKVFSPCSCLAQVVQESLPWRNMLNMLVAARPVLLQIPIFMDLFVVVVQQREAKCGTASSAQLLIRSFETADVLWHKIWVFFNLMFSLKSSQAAANLSSSVVLSRAGNECCIISKFQILDQNFSCFGLFLPMFSDEKFNIVSCVMLSSNVSCRSRQKNIS